ncbi:MAG: MFS transporter [Acetobacteraceae bacterium]
MLGISGPWLTVVLCTAEALTMVGFSSYPLLLAPLRDLWGLSNTDAGIIGGSFFAGYTVAVPFLVSVTDRISSRRVWLLGAALTVTGMGGFGLFANGLVTAALFQAVAGAGLAGTYMPGLRLLADHLPPHKQSRAVALYTACFGIGSATSYLIADRLAQAFTWRAAFLVPAMTAALAAALVVLTVRPTPVRERPGTALLDFRPVLRNRHALGYSLAYFAHSWELYTARSWIITFLGFVAARHGRNPDWLSPAHVAFMMSLLGILSIFMGNEFSIRFGRKRTVVVLMTASAGVAAVLGTTQGPYLLTVMLALLHGPLMTSESASVTAGALGNALPGYRGSTIAMHSMLGFAGGAVGPIVFGATLDLAGGARMGGAWAAAYVLLAVLTLFGPLMLFTLRPRDLAGDGRRWRRPAA